MPTVNAEYDGQCSHRAQTQRGKNSKTVTAVLLDCDHAVRSLPELQASLSSDARSQEIRSVTTLHSDLYRNKLFEFLRISADSRKDWQHGH